MLHILPFFIKFPRKVTVISSLLSSELPLRKQFLGVQCAVLARLTSVVKEFYLCSRHLGLLFQTLVVIRSTYMEHVVLLNKHAVRSGAKTDGQTRPLLCFIYALGAATVSKPTKGSVRKLVKWYPGWIRTWNLKNINHIFLNSSFSHGAPIFIRRQVIWHEYVGENYKLNKINVFLLQWQICVLWRC
jgi:hypothetical protein